MAHHNEYEIYMNDIGISPNCDQEQSQHTNSGKVGKTASIWNDKAIPRIQRKFKVIFLLLAVFIVVMMTLFGIQAHWISQLNIQSIDFTSTLKKSDSNLKNIVDGNKREIGILTKYVNSQKVDCSKIDAHIYKSGNESGGVFEIYVSGQPIDVFCDLSTDGGGWTVIQRRMNGSVDFFRNHSEYVRGFGSVYGEFWIGLQNLYNILQLPMNFKLRIDMRDWDGLEKYAEYSDFDIGPPDNDFIMNVTGFSGTAGDSLAMQNGQKFSTNDHDVDDWAGGDCANTYKGAWWYKGCHESNLNGIYYQGGGHASFADGVNWFTWKGYNYSLKYVDIKIKPIA